MSARNYHSDEARQKDLRAQTLCLRLVREAGRSPGYERFPKALCSGARARRGRARAAQCSATWTSVLRSNALGRFGACAADPRTHPAFARRWSRPSLGTSARGPVACRSTEPTHRTDYGCNGRKQRNEMHQTASCDLHDRHTMLWAVEPRPRFFVEISITCGLSQLQARGSEVRSRNCPLKSCLCRDEFTFGC